MLIGLSSISCFLDSSFSRCIDLLRDSKLNYIDLFLSPPHLYFDNLTSIVHQIKMTPNRDITLTLKAPSFIENLASIIDEIRGLTYSEYLYSLEHARKIGARAVIIKPGMMFFSEKRCRAFVQKKFIESLYNLAEIAEKLRIYLLLENYYYPYEILRSINDFIYFTDIIAGFDYTGFALNIPHLVESGFSVSQLLSKKKVLEKIRLVYIGLCPSPWELYGDVKSASRVLKETKNLLSTIMPEFLVIASISTPILKMLLDGLR